mgnify:CR=1 FL=1
MTRFFAPRPLALLLCAVGALTSLNALAFQQSGKITAGSDMTFFPYEYMENNKPAGFDIELLNGLAKRIVAVRGNCEAEVDQMVLEFPVMADYAILVLNGLTFFATHGHLFNQDQMPPLKAGDILVHGHTHLLKAEKVNGHYILNPGSTSIPKGGNPATYAILCNSGRPGF